MMIGTLKILNFEEDNFYFHDYKIKDPDLHIGDKPYLSEL